MADNSLQKVTGGTVVAVPSSSDHNVVSKSELLCLPDSIGVNVLATLVELDPHRDTGADRTGFNLVSPDNKVVHFSAQARLETTTTICSIKDEPQEGTAMGHPHFQEPAPGKLELKDAPMNLEDEEVNAAAVDWIPDVPPGNRGRSANRQKRKRRRGGRRKHSPPLPCDNDIENQRTSGDNDGASVAIPTPPGPDCVLPLPILPLVVDMEDQRSSHDNDGASVAIPTPPGPDCVLPLPILPLVVDMEDQRSSHDNDGANVSIPTPPGNGSAMPSSPPEQPQGSSRARYNARYQIRSFPSQTTRFSEDFSSAGSVRHRVPLKRKPRCVRIHIKYDADDTTYAYGHVSINCLREKDSRADYYRLESLPAATVVHFMRGADVKVGCVDREYLSITYDTSVAVRLDDEVQEVPVTKLKFTQDVVEDLINRRMLFSIQPATVPRSGTKRAATEMIGEECKICYDSVKKFVKLACKKSICLRCFTLTFGQACPYCRSHRTSYDISMMAISDKDLHELSWKNPDVRHVFALARQ